MIHPQYNNFDNTNVDYDIAIHRLANPSSKMPAKLNLSVLNVLGFLFVVQYTLIRVRLGSPFTCTAAYHLILCQSS